ncbi:MAG: dTMP kinase [Chthonomonadales bacterium]|nr:dTMP kinase [Chthonomonadales bacterium]
MRGLFISFEGIDGAGKTTQARLLAEWLTGRGHVVTALREPGGTCVAERIREILLYSKDEIDPRAELLLFLSSRAQNTAERIRPALAQGHIVICDRYADSSVAYQGHGRGLGADEVRALSMFASGGLAPDLTLLLDLSPEAGLARQKNSDRMEDEPLEFHRRVRHGYLSTAKDDPARVVILDGAQDVEVLRDQIERVVQDRIGT